MLLRGPTPLVPTLDEDSGNGDSDDVIVPITDDGILRRSEVILGSKALGGPELHLRHDSSGDRYISSDLSILELVLEDDLEVLDQTVESGDDVPEMDSDGEYPQIEDGALPSEGIEGAAFVRSEERFAIIYKLFEEIPHSNFAFDVVLEDKPSSSCLHNGVSFNSGQGFAGPDGQVFDLGSSERDRRVLAFDGVPLHSEIGDGDLKFDYAGSESHVFDPGGAVNMLARCGNARIAWQRFDGIGSKHVSCWDTITFVLEVRGYCDEALELFMAILFLMAVESPMGDEVKEQLGSVLFKEAGAMTGVLCSQYVVAVEDHKVAAETRVWEYSQALYFDLRKTVKLFDVETNHSLFDDLIQNECRDVENLVQIGAHFITPTTCLSKFL